MTKLVTAVAALKYITDDSVVEDGTPLHTYLFAATGNQVLVFNDQTERLLTSGEIFPTEFRIHGFSDILNDRMIIYGGRIVAVVSIVFCKDNAEIKLQDRIEFDDWVWGVHWLKHGRMIAVACGHSTTHICDAEDLQNSFALRSEEKELTWSTTLFSAPSGLRAVAGSSFGDVLSWTVLNSDRMEYAEATLFYKRRKMTPTNDKLPSAHRLSAHDGPVMRIAVSPNSERMATASVDRSVRVWETRKSECASCAGECFTPILVHYGHLARVWDVAFITGRRVVSVGEDSSCRVWGEEAGNELTCHHGHAGRNIWSVAVTNGKVATGGEDGAVKVRSLNAAVTKGPFHLPRFENPRKKGLFNESGRSILMTGFNTFLISTDFGRILEGRLRETMEWREVFQDDRGTAFTPCSLVVCGELLIAGQSDGNVVVLRNNVKTAVLKGEGMVMGLFAEAGRASWDVLIASANGTLSHWLVADDAKFIGKYRMERVVKTSLVTAACIARDVGLVITGDRGGRIMTYSLLTQSSNVVSHPLHLSRLHRDRISTLSYSGGSVHASGFDGAITILSLYDSDLEIRSVERAPDRTDTITRCANGQILGFRGSTGVVWGLKDRAEHIRADIGNWRRAHDMWQVGGKTVVGYWRGGGMYTTSRVETGWAMTGGHGGRVCCLARTDDGLVSGGEDGVCVWREGRVLQRLVGHTSVVHGVCARNGIMVTAGGKDEVMFWELYEGGWRERRRVVVSDELGEKTMERCLSVEFGNEEEVFVGRGDGSIIRIAGGSVAVIDHVGGAVNCLGYSDGVLIAGDTRGYITSFCGPKKKETLAHEGGVNAIQAMGEGWISGGDDGNVKHYKLREEQWLEQWCFVAHTAAVTGLALHEDTAWSVGADQRVISYSLSQGKVMGTSGTAIVDASSVANLGNYCLAIGGIGVQLTTKL